MLSSFRVFVIVVFDAKYKELFQSSILNGHFRTDSLVRKKLQQEGMASIPIDDMNFLDAVFQSFQCPFDLGNHSP